MAGARCCPARIGVATRNTAGVIMFIAGVVTVKLPRITLGAWRGARDAVLRHVLYGDGSAAVDDRLHAKNNELVELC